MDRFEVAKEAVRAANIYLGWQRVVKACRSDIPDAPWAAVSTLSLEHEIESIRYWIEDVTHCEEIPEKVNSLYFGIVTLAARMAGGADDLYEQTTLYISGSDELDDPHDETGDWACDPVYFPDGRYYSLKRLDELKWQIEEGMEEKMSREFIDLWDYLIAFSFCGICLSEIFRTAPPERFLGKRKERWAAVGFDDGDLIMLGRWREGRWEAYDESMQMLE